jgi:beta-lactamase superfamily II metal-dependent hydrolase
MEGYVATTNLVKENLVVTVMHLIKNEKTYISASYDLPLSDALNPVDSTKEIKAGAKTKVHMVQLNNTGNSFVIQLKNGHFVVYDGGQEIDAPYLLDYLEKLAPQGEKPVIEAWFISHAHSDHFGAMVQISEVASNTSRIFVEGFYFHNPGIYSAQVGVDGNIQKTMLSANFFQNQKGEKTPLYRPQMGQRYYFSDIIIDVCLTPELFPLNSYYYNTDINDTSIWLMAHIENQKFLVGGDAAHTASRAAMSIFDESYFDVEVFAVFHHGINVYDYFTNYITVDTVLYTSYRLGSIYKDPKITSSRVEENALLQQKAKESISHENGTVVLSFPYKVGEAEIMEPFNWKYNEGGKQVIVDFDSN